MADFFGIDFGTTNSAVISISEIDGKKIRQITIGDDSERPLPSYVAINRTTGEVKTGLEAKNSISESSEYVIFPSIKTIIDEDHVWEIAGKKWDQIDIASELFKALKTNAMQVAGQQMNKAVVAVPIGFTSKQKNNVRKAAKKAGIDVTMFVSEPTSAYCSRKDEMRRFHNVAVFDWGGGTLDVVVLHIAGGVIHEMSSVGIKIAGNDIDRKLAERICLKIATKTGQDFRFEDLKSEYKLRLLNICENAKCDLADEDIVTISMARLDTYGRVFEKIDYDYFSLLIENEVKQAMNCLMEALKQAGMNRESIDCIICEGGSSRLRPLQTELLKHFDRNKLIFPRTAMWDIGSGAAEIAYKPGCYTLNRPIGIMLSNNSFYPLLRVGQRVPTEEKTVTFGILDTSNEARFVLTDGVEGNNTFSEIFPVKMRGFSDEVIKVSCYVDADMIFRMKICTNRMPDDYFRAWTYSNLKVSFELDAPSPKSNPNAK